MTGFINLRFPIGIAAASGKEHPFIMEAYVIDQRKLIIRSRLFKRPEKVAGSVLCPASSAPLIKCSTSWTVFPFGLPPPCTISMFFIDISPKIYFAVTLSLL